MFDVGSRQRKTDMDSKRATTKCVATALICQPIVEFLVPINEVNLMKSIFTARSLAEGGIAEASCPSVRLCKSYSCL